MTWAEGTVLSGLVSKIINNGVDASWEQIKKAVDSRTKPHQSLESQIYNLIVKSLNRVAENRYKDWQDRVFVGAEIMLQDFKDQTIRHEDAIKNGLRCVCSGVSQTKCKSFVVILEHEISKDCYSELRRELMLAEHRKEGEKTSRIEEKIDAADQKIEVHFEEIKKALNDSGPFHKNGEVSSFQNNKKSDYIKIWNRRLFLHQGRDSRPLTLANAFIMPAYKVHCNLIARNRFFNFDLETMDHLNGEGDGKATAKKYRLDGNNLDAASDQFRKIEGCMTMLLAGVPGIGKTTITAWLANQYEADEDLIILRFRDWERDELKAGLLQAVCGTLACKTSALNGKMLVLDGFDEMKCLDIREEILAAFFNDIQDLHDLKCMITSRPAYIDAAPFSYVLELEVFDLFRIKKFYQKITDSELDVKKIAQDNLDVLGVPVILYMAIMSRMDLTGHTTRPGLYSRIFAESGGIFDRFYYGGSSYDEGAHPFRNSRNINTYLEFLSETAFKMFKSNRLTLSKESCKVPALDFQGKKVGILEFPIKHLFESTECQIEFIHKSIYEYFTAEYMLRKISQCIQKGRVEALARALGEFFKDNILSDEIAEYLSYQIRQQNVSIACLKKSLFQMPSFYVSEEYLSDAFSIMLRKGMTHFCEESPNHSIERETNVFSNMICLFRHCLDSENKLRIKHVKEFISYLALQTIWTGNKFVMHVDLSEARFENVSLRNLVFKDVNFRHAVFQSVDLSESRFEKLDLSEAAFFQVKMEKTVFENVNLERAVFKDSDFLNGMIIDSLIETKMTDMNLTGTAFLENLIKFLDFTDSNLRDTRFVKNRIPAYISVIFQRAILDKTLILNAEKIFGKRIKNCMVDLCDSVFSYAEYCQIREQKLDSLQGEILDMIRQGKNYTEQKK